MDKINEVIGIGYSAAFMKPMLALVMLTLVIFLVMYVRRIAFMNKHKMHPEEFKTPEGKAKMEGPQNYAAENYNHLFEMPVLFYVVCFLFVISGKGDDLALTLAWAFVAIRALHSFVQISYNKIMHRFLLFFASGMVMMALAIKAWLVIL